MERRPQDVEQWLADLVPSQRQQAEWLGSVVHAADAAVTEAIRWRRLTFTLDDNWHHWLCAVAANKKGVNLAFHKGSLLEDPDGLLDGDGRYLRQIPYDHAAARPEAVTALVREAITHQTDMIDDERR